MNIRAINPFRYRSYYYDTETGLYYLNSRYYDPETGRFINADSISYLAPATLGGLSLYVYCLNNPIAFCDLFGTTPSASLDTDNDGIIDCYVYTYIYTKHFFIWKSSSIGKVYIYTNKQKNDDFNSIQYPEGFNYKTDLLVADRLENDNKTMYAYQAHKVDSKYREHIIECMFEYARDFGVKWDRTPNSVLTEWDSHHFFAFSGSRAQNIDFDESEEGCDFWYYVKKAFFAVLSKIFGE